MVQHNEIGKIGEEIACLYLKGKGYSIVERNYRRKFGELDVICEKNGELLFVEVKSASTRSLSSEGHIRPEEHMHATKLGRFSRTIDSYLEERQERRDWRASLLVVMLDFEAKQASCELIFEL